MHSNDDAGSRLHALGCVLLLVLCALLTKPYVDLGVNDDWSYIRSAQILAQTGHIVYNGSTPMLGWQLYLGALFIKFFGFSWTKVRLSILLLSLITTYLLHRVFSGFGLVARSASLATLTIMLSPVWLVMTVTFMTDAAGLFTIVLCLYGCQRALRARSDAASLKWLYFVAVTNMLGGTARQIAWLGVLVIVPSTAWLLRQEKRVLLHGLFLWIAGIFWIVLCMHWFLAQPYSLPEKLIDGPLNALAFTRLGVSILDDFLSVSLFSLPLLIAYPFMLRNICGKSRLVVIACFTVVLLSLMVVAYSELKVGPIHQQLLPPWLGTNVTPNGIMSCFEMVGKPAIVLRNRAQIILGLTVLFSALSCLAHLILAKRRGSAMAAADGTATLSRNQTNGILIPFACAYLLLLTPRGMFHEAFDRYLVPLLIVVAVFVLRDLKEQTRPSPFWPGVVTLSVFTCYAVAGTHDLFSMDRARVQAAEEVTGAGIPRTALEGGFEYDGWTQIMAQGHINDPRLRVPIGSYRPTTRSSEDPCHTFFFVFVPIVEPKYALAFDPDTCYSRSSFAPVGYSTWLPPHGRAIYVQQVR